MSILVRKIRDYLWSDAPQMKANSFIKRLAKGHKYKTSADTITKCLSTDENKLSCWEIENESQIENALLALITGGHQGSISTIAYVLIPEEVLSAAGLGVVPSTKDADTAVESLKPFHRNIVELNYESLGKVQDIVIDCIKQKRKARKTRSELWKILRKGISEGKVNVNKLTEDLQGEIKRKYPDFRHLFSPEIEESSSTGENVPQAS